MRKPLLTLISICLHVIFVSSAFGVDPPKKIALLIGVSDYFDKNMDDLRYAENDVTIIGRELKNLGFDVTVLTGKNASKASADKKINAFLASSEKLENDDIVFVMFSGHGQQLMAVQEKKVFVNGKVETIKQKAETPYFCPRDAKPFNPLRHSLTGKTEKQIADEFNLISLNRVIGELGDRSNSLQNLFVVDACRNNPAKGKTANITGSTTKELPNGLTMLFAAKSGQKSWESSDPKIKHGVMSHFMIEGLQGKAANRKNEVTWKRLVAYVSEEVEYDRGGIAGAGDRIQNPHAIGSSNLIVMGKLTKTYVSALTGMEFIRIASGNFRMGSEKGVAGEKPVHRVTISKPFYFGKYEVTQKQWKTVMGTEPWKGKALMKKGDDYPATYVSWDDAVAYCKKLSARDGRTYRLPTEAEWEYACRGGTETKYSFGDSDSSLGRYGWYDKNAWDIGDKYAHRVGAKESNPFGLYDIHGNVFEWCEDYYSDDFYQSTKSIDPVNSTKSSSRVLRGGSWVSSSIDCRSASRGGGTASYRSNGIGFRVVCEFD